MDETEEPLPKSLADCIRELPAGAIRTWEGVKILVSGSEKPVYLFVIDEPRNPSKLLQFKNPKLSLNLLGNRLMYHDGQTVAVEKFFNRTFCPTFFIFNNYMLAYGFQRRLSTVGIEVPPVEKHQ